MAFKEDGKGIISWIKILLSVQAGAAAMIGAGSLSGVAVANEFDLMSSPTPTRTYIIDDAGVLNRTTKKSLTDDLTKLEV